LEARTTPGETIGIGDSVSSNSASRKLGSWENWTIALGGDEFPVIQLLGSLEEFADLVRAGRGNDNVSSNSASRKLGSGDGGWHQ
jgi:hypothetical protein